MTITKLTLINRLKKRINQYAIYVTSALLALVASNSHAVEWDLLANNIIVQSNIGMAIQKTDFYWNIGLPVTGPDILSELKYNNQNRIALDVSTEVLVRGGVMRGMLVEAFYQRSLILSGDNQDSDYFESGQNAEFSRSVADIDGNSSSSLTLGGGYRWMYGHNVNFARYITLIGGIKKVETVLLDKNGVQVIPVMVAFDGLHSTYTTDWDGQYLAFQIDQMKQNNVLSFRYELFDMSYRGVGNWNLRDDLAHPQSFLHEADATGYLIKLSYKVGLSPKSYVGFHYESRQLKTKRGKDYTFLADGSVLSPSIFNIGLEKSNAIKIDYGRWF